MARRPSALAMEACNDIAYSVLDAEDSSKKGLFFYNDLIEAVAELPNSPVETYIVNSHKARIAKHKGKNLRPKEKQYILMQIFRVHAIHLTVSAISVLFIAERSNILCGKFSGELIEESAARDLCHLLK